MEYCRMNLENLSDYELLNAVCQLQGNEREVTLKIIYHLIEIERRKLYFAQGYSSMFDYCTRKLKYSEGGKTELSNLRLLCQAHNLHLAKMTFN